MDSSRLLRGLLTLVQESEEDSSESAQSTVISVKVLRRLLSAIHFRDARTVKHCRRVGLISVGIASRLGWDKEDRRIIEIAALLHDLGKIGIPDHILAKPGKLSPDEAEFIASHHRVALNLMQACRVHPGVIEIIAQSHGLNDEDIEERSALGLAARILAVADAYDSLTSRQSYRAAFSRWEALKILDEQAGKQFDRNVVAALGRWLDGPEAAALADEKAAEVSIQVNAPIDMEARVGASQLCLIFNYLYLLETLYEAFYIVDLHRRVAIWNSGAVRLFQKSTASVAGKPWRRGLVCSHSTLTDPMEAAFTSGQPQCHRMKVVDYERGEREVDVQSLPVFGKDEQIIGVAELVCDVKQSKQNRGQFRSLQMAATRDALTNVFNRGELENKLNELHANWSADPKQIFSVVFIDLDHFKQINDRLSHAIGDRVLIDVARLLQDELYSGEIVGRYGGEEFVVVCPETDLPTAIDRGERLRRTLMATRMADRDDLRVTASLGVAQVEAGDTVESVVDRADQALYDAKRQGRNRTCHKASESDPLHQEKSTRKGAEDWIHRSEFRVCVAANLLNTKLTAFVEEQSAKILKVTPKVLEVQIGAAGIFTGWSKLPPEKIPVKVTVHILESPPTAPSSGNPRAMVKTVIEPLTKSCTSEDFHVRAGLIMQSLRSFLIGE